MTGERIFELNCPMPAKYLTCVLAALLAACATAPAPAPASAPAPTAAPVSSEPEPAPAPRVILMPVASKIDELLAYHQSLRRLSHPELVGELQALERKPESNHLALQRAMLLAILQGEGDIVRAQRYAEGVVTSQEPDAESLRPLARMLAAHYGELRRLSEQAARLHQQNREYVRRVGQLSNMLEGLKAIERALPAGPAAQTPPAPQGK